MRLNAEEAGGAAIVAVPGVCLLGICIVRGGGFDGLGELLNLAGTHGAILGAGLAGIAAVAGLGWVWSHVTSSSQRTFRVHHDAGQRGLAARHEAGHIVMAQRVGCRVIDARIFNDGTGWTAYQAPVDLWPVEDVAISVAGEVASGTSEGCGADHRHRDQTLRAMGWMGRSQTRSHAYGMCRRHVGPGLFGPPSKVARYERRLLRKGRL